MLLDFIKGITCDSSVPTLTEQEVKMILNAQLSEKIFFACIGLVYVAVIVILMCNCEIL